MPSQNCVGMLGATDCSVSVTYTPSATIKVTGTLTIDDVPDGIIKTVKLTGTGRSTSELVRANNPIRLTSRQVCQAVFTYLGKLSLSRSRNNRWLYFSMSTGCH